MTSWRRPDKNVWNYLLISQIFKSWKKPLKILKPFWVSVAKYGFVKSRLWKSKSKSGTRLLLDFRKSRLYSTFSRVNPTVTWLHLGGRPLFPSPKKLYLTSTSWNLSLTLAKFTLLVKPFQCVTWKTSTPSAFILENPSSWHPARLYQTGTVTYPLILVNI